MGKIEQTGTYRMDNCNLTRQIRYTKWQPLTALSFYELLNSCRTPYVLLRLCITVFHFSPTTIDYIIRHIHVCIQLCSSYTILHEWWIFTLKSTFMFITLLPFLLAQLPFDFDTYLIVVLRVRMSSILSWKQLSFSHFLINKLQMSLYESKSYIFMLHAVVKNIDCSSILVVQVMLGVLHPSLWCFCSRLSVVNNELVRNGPCCYWVGNFMVVTNLRRVSIMLTFVILPYLMIPELPMRLFNLLPVTLAWYQPWDGTLLEVFDT